MAVTIDEIDVEVTERPAAPQKPSAATPAPAREDAASALRRMAERQDRLRAD